MNTGQMILTTGAMVLLGTTVLTVNRTHLQQGTILRQTELGIYAVSLATSYIQKASNMYYDEKSVGNALTLSTTPGAGVLSSTLGIDNPHLHPVLVGMEPTEIANKDSTFDDFDDYNNFNTTISVQNVDNFSVKAFVYYISGTPPYVKQTATSWLKQMDICINTSVSRKVFEENASSTSQAGVDTVKMSYIFSYY